MDNLARPNTARNSAVVEPGSTAAEQYRLLLHRLERLSERRPMRVIAVTSAARGEGRSATALNLALTAVDAGRNVALVECDLRRPSVAAALGLAPRAGLGEVLTGRAELAEALVRTGRLSVLCAGEAHDPAAALGSLRLGSMMDALRASHDLVVLDAPPALAFSDAERLAAAADGVLMVVRAQKTPRAVVRLALESLGDKVAGIVLNAVDTGSAIHGRYLYGDPGAA
jgi:capsular exopolysaccharide synthesis family protein